MNSQRRKENETNQTRRRAGMSEPVAGADKRAGVKRYKVCRN